MTSLLSHICSPYQERYFTAEPVLKEMKPDSTSAAKDSGVVDLNEHSTMSGFSTPTLLPIAPTHSIPCTRSTSKQSADNTVKEFVKSRKHPFPPSSFPRAEEWGRQQPTSTRDLQPSSVTRDVSHTVPPWAGYQLATHTPQLCPAEVSNPLPER